MRVVPDVVYQPKSSRPRRRATAVSAAGRRDGNGQRPSVQFLGVLVARRALLLVDRRGKIIQAACHLQRFLAELRLAHFQRFGKQRLGLLEIVLEPLDRPHVLHRLAKFIAGHVDRAPRVQRLLQLRSSIRELAERAIGVADRGPNGGFDFRIVVQFARAFNQNVLLALAESELITDAEANLHEVRIGISDLSTHQLLEELALRIDNRHGVSVSPEHD